MKEYTYIVFEDSGLDISKLIRENNPKAKIIHLYHGNHKDKSKADEIIELEIDFEGCIPNSHAWYNVVKDNKKINKQINKVLNNTKNIIIIDEIIEEVYPLELHITKKAIERGINCINIFFEPFYFMGKRREKCFTNFFDEIIRMKNNNYCISCNYVENHLLTKYAIPEMCKLIHKIAYNVSINLKENTNTIVDKVIDEEKSNEKKQLTGKYKYVQVSYEDDISGKWYSYKTTIDDIHVGDIVLVDRNGNEAYGTVEAINYYTKDTAPYPLENTKDIIKVLEEFEYDADNNVEDIKYCPKCHGELIPIIYGLPSYETFLKQEKGEVKLGGCMVNPNNPNYYCKTCDKEYK